jgi:hypothetical protein
MLLVAKWYHLCVLLSVQLGFLLLACFWRFDFPPMLVLVIAILNDGNKTAAGSLIDLIPTSTYMHN